MKFWGFESLKENEALFYDKMNYIYYSINLIKDMILINEIAPLEHFEKRREQSKFI